MSDLLTAALTQIGYARKSRDLSAAEAHLDKAEAFIKRAADVKPIATAVADHAAAEGDPLLELTEDSVGGKKTSMAARMDATAIAEANGGNTPNPGAARYAGQAEKEGFSGIEVTTKADSGGYVLVYTVFLDGKVVGVEEGDTNTDQVELAERFGLPA